MILRYEAVLSLIQWAEKRGTIDEPGAAETVMMELGKVDEKPDGAGCDHILLRIEIDSVGKG